MQISEQIFGKSWNTISNEDITHFFKVEVSESTYLECKSYSSNGAIEKKFVGITRAICAMLNSEGGIVIWGAPREDRKVIQGQGTRSVFMGDLTYLPDDLDKDWIANKINDSIVPLPSGILIKILKFELGSVVLFQVPKSEYRPHQTKDVYYMRLDGQSKPAPHHYVEALFKREKLARLSGHIRVERGNKIHEKASFPFTVYIFNRSKAVTDINIHARLNVDIGELGWYRTSPNQHATENGKKSLVLYRKGEPLHY